MTQLTIDQKLDSMNKRLKRMEASTHIQTFIMVAGFIGIFSLATLIDKGKNIIKK